MSTERKHALNTLQCRKRYHLLRWMKLRPLVEKNQEWWKTIHRQHTLNDLSERGKLPGLCLKYIAKKNPVTFHIIALYFYTVMRFIHFVFVLCFACIYGCDQYCLRRKWILKNQTSKIWMEMKLFSLKLIPTIELCNPIKKNNNKCNPF